MSSRPSAGYGLPEPARSLGETQDASAGEPPRAEVAVSQRLGRFLLLRKLGAGGMGTVAARGEAAFWPAAPSCDL